MSEGRVLFVVLDPHWMSKNNVNPGSQDASFRDCFPGVRGKAILGAPGSWFTHALNVSVVVLSFHIFVQDAHSR